MEIKRENIISAYNSADENGKRMLIALFGEEAVKQADNRPVTERVKTFEDACYELGDEHPFVMAFDCYLENVHDANIQDANMIAYLKLRIICAALNEGWEPQFTKGEKRWCFWYDLITKNEYNKLTDEEKSRAVLRPSYNAVTYSGLACAVALYDSSRSHCGSRLAFKTLELAEYAGVQFIELYADFYFLADGKAE